ncbi:hypothetical protein NE237_014137 [Protea cynaroides]|uniref:Cryptochrome C-terminal domain-containing protein n=1 Tax=Protea cynaroides TaxID=273540 RepID=A0A9Q0H577_9MAGN|nr:hypothetical protein NE237_014137 [Protea cynaroides]
MVPSVTSSLQRVDEKQPSMDIRRSTNDSKPEVTSINVGLELQREAPNQGDDDEVTGLEEWLSHIQEIEGISVLNDGEVMGLEERLPHIQEIEVHPLPNVLSPSSFNLKCVNTACNKKKHNALKIKRSTPFVYFIKKKKKSENSSSSFIGFIARSLTQLGAATFYNFRTRQSPEWSSVRSSTQLGRVHSAHGIYAGIAAVGGGLSPAPGNASGIPCTFVVYRAGYLPHHCLPHHHVAAHHVVAPRTSPRTVSRTFLVVLGLSPVARSASGIGDTPFEDRVVGYHPHHPNDVPQTSPHSVSHTFLVDVGLSPVARSASGIGDTPSEDRVVGYHLHHPNDADAPRTSPRSVSRTFLVVVGLSPVARTASGIADTPSEDHGIGYLLHHPNDVDAPRNVSRTFLVVVGLSPVVRSASGIADAPSEDHAGYLLPHSNHALRSGVGTGVAGVGLALPASNDVGTAGIVFVDHVGSLPCHLQP